MALALIGNIASKLLPSVISWGMGKLNNSNIGRGASGKMNYLINKGINLTKNPAFRQVVKTVGE